MKTKYVGINENIENYGDEKWYEYDGEELSNYIETLSSEQTEVYLKRMNDNDENIYVELANPSDNMSTYYHIVACWRNDTDMTDEEFGQDGVDLINITINSTLEQQMKDFYNDNENKFEELDEYGDAEYETLSCLCSIWKDGKSFRFDYDWEAGRGSPHIIEEHNSELDVDDIFDELFDIISVMDVDDYLEYKGYELETGRITYYDNIKSEQVTVRPF